MTLADQFLKTLKALIENRGLVQSRLGEKAGFSKAHFSGIINGNGNVSLETLGKISEALELPPWGLLMSSEELKKWEQFFKTEAVIQARTDHLPKRPRCSDVP
jgi:transcriptional regulator with XRE-family HTH domain